MTRVALFHNVVAPYRHCLFRELARRVELVVWYASRSTIDRQWCSDVPSDYESRFLVSCTAHAFRRPFTVCSGLSQAVRDASPQVVVSVLTRSNIVDVLRLGRWCRTHRVPFVLWVGDVVRVQADDVPRSVTKAIDLLFSLALRLATGFISYSPSSDEWLESHRMGAKPRVTGTQVLDPADAVPRLSIDGRPESVRVLFVGKHEARKGLPELIRALSALPAVARSRVELVTAGSGPMSVRLSSLVEQGVKVRMLGSLEAERLSEVYRDADLLVLPSVHDPWGFVTNEAMAMGTPVLASHYAGSRELALRAGWVADVRDHAMFVEVLAKAIDECRSADRRMAAITAEKDYRPGVAAKKIATFLDSLGSS